VSDKETAPDAATEIWRRFAATFPEVEPASEIGFDKPIAQIIAKHAEECKAQAPTQLDLPDLADKILDILDELTPEDAEHTDPIAVAYQRVALLLDDEIPEDTPQGVERCQRCGLIERAIIHNHTLQTEKSDYYHQFVPRATPQGTPTECELCGHSAHVRTLRIFGRVKPKFPATTPEEWREFGKTLTTPAECPQCGSKDFWTVLPACHGGKAHKWHRKENL
jgi:hypothetical protein